MLGNSRAHVDACLDGIEAGKWWLEYIVVKRLYLDLLNSKIIIVRARRDPRIQTARVKVAIERQDGF